MESPFFVWDFCLYVGGSKGSAGGLDEGVVALGGVLAALLAGYGGGNAKLYVLHLDVVLRAGAEAYCPAVGELAGEGHSSSSACLVAEGAYVGEA